MSVGLVGWVIPAEVVDTVSEVNIFLVEDRGPLEGCLEGLAKDQIHRLLTHSMQSLTSTAMAELGGQRLFSAQLVLDFPTVTATLPLRIELPIIPMNLVWCSVFPLVLFSVGPVTGLELM